MVSVNLRRRHLAAIAFALILTWFGILLVLLPGASKGAQYLKTLFDSTLRDRRFQCNPGPWGNLEYSVLSLELSDKSVELIACKELPEWFFPGIGEGGLARLADDAGLDSSARAAFLDTSRWTVEDGGILVRPTRDLVLSLAPEARAILYSLLASSPRNHWQRSPVVRRAEIAGFWLHNDDFSPEVQSLLQKLFYRRGASIIFADVEVVLSSIEDLEEKRRFLVHLFCMPTMFLRLRLDPDTDIDEVSRYWQHDANATHIKALLNSAANAGTGQAVDVVHLLPPLPRMLLYSNLPPGTSEPGLRHDCFWTSVNFFNEIPDDRFRDAAAVIAEIKSRYQLVSLERALGDVILLVGKDQRPVHSCNYVADNIVFTKNGGGSGMPWILADLRDVIALYSSAQDLEVLTFRRAEGPSSVGK